MRPSLIPIILVKKTEPEVVSWVARVNTAGGSVSNSTKTYVNNFVREAKAAGIWSTFTRLNLCCGDFIASFIPIVNILGSTQDTNVNLISSDYSESLGWQTDGSTKYINTGYAPSETTGGLSAYLRTTQTSNTTQRSLIGCRDVGVTQCYWLYVNTSSLGAAESGTANGMWGGAASGNGATVGGGSVAAMWHVSRTSSTRADLYKNGVSAGNNTNSVTPAASGNSLFVFCRNASGAATFCESGTRIAGYATDTGMSTDQALAYYGIMQKFQAALSRQV